MNFLNKFLEQNKHFIILNLYSNLNFHFLGEVMTRQPRFEINRPLVISILLYFISIVSWFHSISKKSGIWIKLPKMVLCYQNCFELICEKIVLLIEKNCWNLRLKAKNLQNFWDHLNNLFRQWNVRTIFGNRMLLFLFLEVSHI